MSKDNSQNVKVEDEKKSTANMSDKTTMTDIFTAREQEIMLNALLCMKEAPAVDFNDLAARLGMSNVRSASNAWAALRKKIQERNPNPDGTPVLATAKRTPATGGKRKKGIPTSPVTPTVSKKSDATATATTSGDNDDSADEGPADTKPPAAKRAKKVVEADGETPKPKAKRAPAKQRAKKVAAAPAADGEEEEAASEVIKKTPAKAKTTTPRKRATKVVKSEATVVKSEDEEDNGADEVKDMRATAEEAIKVAQAAAVAKANGEEEYAGGYAVDEDDDEGVEVIGGPDAGEV